MSRSRIMELQLSIKGRPLKTFALAEGSIIAGRDPEAGIFLDNVGVSRHHAKFEKTPEGFFVEDLASANGTHLNDQPVRRAVLKDRDVVRVGKFSIWVSMRPDRRESADSRRRLSPMVFQGTTVLKADEIEHILAASKDEQEASPFLEVVNSNRAVEVPGPSRVGISKRTLAWSILLTFIVAAGVGAAAIWFFLIN